MAERSVSELVALEHELEAALGELSERVYVRLCADLIRDLLGPSWPPVRVDPVTVLVVQTLELADRVTGGEAVDATGLLADWLAYGDEHPLSFVTVEIAANALALDLWHEYPSRVAGEWIGQAAKRRPQGARDVHGSVKTIHSEDGPG